tara:strand:+ start:343 stop:858 length:516 start_codon:yes stop_codon:yes gene_type:complete
MSVYNFIVSIPSSRSSGERSYISSQWGHRAEARWGAINFYTTLEAHQAMSNIIQTMLDTYGEGDTVLERVRNYSVETNGVGRYERIVCNDGFNMSVQAHNGAYCDPRIDFAPIYKEVEVGYPSEEEELLMPYVEDSSRPTETVYGYVPSKVIFQVIQKHGGLKLGMVPPLG